jgi:hypothetical protein
MRALGGCDHRIVEIRICGDHPVARTGANIIPEGWLLDLWLVNIGPFLMTVGTTSFEGDIYRGSPS